jgi:hypothetical protein
MFELDRSFALPISLLVTCLWASPVTAADEVTERAVPGAIPLRAPVPSISLRPLPKLPQTPGLTPQLLRQQTMPSPGRKPLPPPRFNSQDSIKVIDSLPGGKQVLQDAARRGARVASTMQSSSQSSSGTPPPPTQSPMTLVPGQGIVLAGAQVSGVDAIEGGFVLSNYQNAPNGGSFMKPFAKFGVCLQTDGWYLIEVVAESYGMNPTQVRANLYQDRDNIDNNVLGTDALVFSWDYSGRPLESAPSLFPALLELSAGCHRFFWSLENHFVRFQEVRISPL